MKLILASKEKFLLNKGYSLLDIPKKNLKIGLINTALTPVQDQDYLEYIKEYFSKMDLSGIDYKLFDISGKTEEEIYTFFKDRNVIQVNGGNLFFLIKKIRESKFDLILESLLKKGLYYIGCSAGTYLMTPTIEVAGWKKSRNRFGVEDFTALDYVPFLIKCHYTDDKKNEILNKIDSLKYPLRILRDDQCFLIEDNKIQFIGNNEEVILK